MDDAKLWVAQAAILEPFVVSLTAVLLQAVKPATRYKPTFALAVGVVLGLAIGAAQRLPWDDSAIIGGIAGLAAAALYLAGKAIEQAKAR